jgi:hypothetical protein
MTDYKQEIEEIFKTRREELEINNALTRYIDDQLYFLKEELTQLIETEKIAELRLIEKAQQDYDEWSGFTKDTP